MTTRTIEFERDYDDEKILNALGDAGIHARIIDQADPLAIEPAPIADSEPVAEEKIKELSGEFLYSVSSPFSQIGGVVEFVRAIEREQSLKQPVAKVEPMAFGLSAEQIKGLLDRCGKPEEIAGDPATQHSRVRELIRWFEREGNPKWFREHAFELVYYIATTDVNRSLDLEKVKQLAYIEGVNISPSDRDMGERHGWWPAQPLPAPTQQEAVPDGRKMLALKEKYAHFMPERGEYALIGINIDAFVRELLTAPHKPSGVITG